MENSNQKKVNLKNALCYVPFVAIFFYFMGEKKTKDFEKHIRYGILLLGIYFIMSFLFSFLYLFRFNSLLFLAYVIISGILGYKAYNGEKIDVDILDNIGDKIKDTVNSKDDDKK